MSCILYDSEGRAGGLRLLSADLGVRLTWITHVGPVLTRVLVSEGGRQDRQRLNPENFENALLFAVEIKKLASNSTFKKLKSCHPVLSLHSK